MEQLYAVLILILGIAGLIYFGLLKTIFIEFALFLDPSITQDKISTLENLNQGQLFGQPEIAQVTNFMTATGLNGFLLILVTLLLVQGLSNLLSEKPPFLIAIILKRKLLNFELLEDLSWTNKFFINWYLYSFDKILSKNAGLINSERDHLFSINSIEFSYKDSFESEFIIKALKQSRVFLSISRSLSLLKFGKFRLLGNQNDDLLFRDLYSFLSSIINSYSQSPKKLNNYEISILYFTLGAYSGVLLPKYITARLFGFRIQKIFSSTEFENPFMLLEKTISTDQLIQIIDDIKKFLSFSEQQEIEKYIQFLLTRNIISVNELSSCNMIHNYLLGKGTLK